MGPPEAERRRYRMEGFPRLLPEAGVPLLLLRRLKLLLLHPQKVELLLCPLCRIGPLHPRCRNRNSPNHLPHCFDLMQKSLVHPLLSPVLLWPVAA